MSNKDDYTRHLEQRARRLQDEATHLRNQHEIAKSVAIVLGLALSVLLLIITIQVVGGAL